MDRLLTKIAAGRARPAKLKPSQKRRKTRAPARPTPVYANRAGEMIRKMFSLAVQWKMRPDNPAFAFGKRPETARDRFLINEIERLANAPGKDEDQRAANIIRLCMLTGARLGEVRTATFDQFNLDLAIWTKQRRIHRVPVSHEAVAVIRLRCDIGPKGCLFLFPGDVPDQTVGDPKRFWPREQRAPCAWARRRAFGAFLTCFPARLFRVWPSLSALWSPRGSWSSSTPFGFTVGYPFSLRAIPRHSSKCNDAANLYYSSCGTNARSV